MHHTPRPRGESPAPSQRPSHVIRKGKRSEAVAREKTGCWSCRIRRKKCHGKEPGKDDCSDCLRLGIQCLGWGEKRPEWLKKSVEEKREQIKMDLLARNMIKGQRKGGLSSPNGTLDDSESPPPSLPAVYGGPASPYSRSHGYSRHPGAYPTPPSTLFGTAPPLPGQNGMVLPHATRMESPEPMLGGLSSDSSSTTAVDKTSPGLPMLAYPNQYFPPPVHSTSSTRTSSSAHGDAVPGSGATQYDRVHLEAVASGTALKSEPPTMAWGHRQADKLLQNISDNGSDSGMEEISLEKSKSESKARAPPKPEPTEMSLATYRSIASNKLDEEQWRWLTHYDKEVLPMQFLLHGPETRQLMLNVALASEPPSAMLCLAAVHHYQLHPNYTPTARDKYWVSAVTSLSEGVRSPQDALTALHLVSVSLFSGCQPEWAPFVNMARNWCQSAFPGTDGNAFRRALIGADPLTQFVSKTTLWMDIFGAISTQTVPRFLSWYRALMKPKGVDINGVELDAIGMDKLMGCDNEVMLAFAEIAALDAWKLEQPTSWSNFLLVDMATRISKELLDSARPVMPPRAAAGVSDEVFMRKQMSAVFRASAKIYLHTVVSGYRPAVPEIQLAVAETIACLKAINTEKKPYDRSLVLPLFIAGVMTDDPVQRKFIEGRLSNIKDLSVGNCAQVLALMRRVWQKRETDGGEVSWRETMKDMNMSLLFV
ncbi:hypothetical protein DACRYDRAFT_93540 [Dacryopinax primogenitus]|uniref:Zn(2)-C6 fungal-type domain-containing protein n=1 Tax=Dacryopinax primogenitus (strain DJM 731) TaxID=1858805 RepID=M5GCX6_DACPD|nr:uncharacterized protein DACRYDRAFT_93540 [Dacryopinax primogenitus]EJU04112.1 hypothetical protein DACRYDRAFT_93540 [Dacryopinax primogenitus]